MRPPSATIQHVDALVHLTAYTLFAVGTLAEMFVQVEPPFDVFIAAPAAPTAVQALELAQLMP